MNRQPPDTPAAFADEPPVCHINDRMYTRLQWLVYGGVGVVVAGMALAIYRTCRIVLEYFSESLTK